MLCLSRKRGESIVIGDESNLITITVYEIVGDHKVRLAIEAPKHVPVHRKEVWTAIHNAATDAAGEEPK